LEGNGRTSLKIKFQRSSKEAGENTKTIVLYFVSHPKERRLRASEKRVLRILALQEGYVASDYSKLKQKQLYTLYTLPDILRAMK
jgi:hypothetical protein